FRETSKKPQQMSFWVYILRCADNSYYTGHTDNLEDQALACEQQIKGWSRSKKEALMRRDWAEVSRLARRRHPSRTSGRPDLIRAERSKPKTFLNNAILSTIQDPGEFAFGAAGRYRHCLNYVRSNHRSWLSPD